MAVPKKKKSKSRCGMNNAHRHLKLVFLSFDDRGNMHLSHRATKMPDGSYYYKGRVIITGKKADQ